ncbi:MAG: hypothetical protein QM692_02810 [Thermomicrobiales bacterium]
MRRSLLVSALFLTASAVSFPHVAYAQDAAQRPAAIRAGNCASIGDPLVALDNVVAPGGDELGPDGATPVEQSVTVVPQLLPDLLAGGYVVVVDKSVDEPGTLAACGVIGGVVGADGTLAVGIGPMDGSRLDGVAYFDPKRDDSGTTVTLLMVDNRAVDDANGPAGPIGMAGEDGTITLGGVSETTDTMNVLDDGSGPAPAEDAAPAPAPEPAASGAESGAAPVESAESSDGKGAKGGSASDGDKGGRGGKGGKGGKGGNGNAGNDGSASASG